MPQGKGTYGSKVGRPPKKKMGGGKMKSKPLAMKEGGRPMSEMLEDKLYERQEDKFKSSEKKNRDRGSSGRATEVEETLKALDEFRKDRKLLDKYGKDAPKSRAFMTERPKKMSMGGKCRGMGAATRGGNFKMG